MRHKTSKPQNDRADGVKAGKTSAVLEPATPLTLPLADSQFSALEIQLRAHLNELFEGIGEVRATTNNDRIIVAVKVPAGAPTLPIRNSAVDWLQSVYGASAKFDVELSQ